MEKIGHRYVIQYFHLKGLSSINIKAEYWVEKFERGRMSCEDEHRSGRLNEVTIIEMVKKIQEMVLDKRQLKVRDLTDMVGISKSAVHRILTENLDMRKLCAKRVLGLYIMEQK